LHRNNLWLFMVIKLSQLGDHRSAARSPTPQNREVSYVCSTKLMPDVEGLAHQVDPLSRRGFFLTGLGCGPRRLHARRRTGPRRRDPPPTPLGLAVGEAKVKVSDARCGLLRQAGEAYRTRRHPGSDGDLWAARIHQRTSRGASASSELSPSHPIIIPQRGRPHQDHQSRNSCRRQHQPDAELLSDLDATVAWRSRSGDTNRPASWASAAVDEYGVGIRGPQQASGGRRILWARVDPARAKIALAEEPDRAAHLEMKAPVPASRRGRSRHSAHQVDAMKRRRFKAREKTFEIKSMPAHRTASTPTIAPAYRKDAAEERLNQMIAWFKKYKVLA